MPFTWETLLRKYGISCSRYILAAGLVYFVFYIWKRHDWKHLRIQPNFPKPTRIYNEIKWSIVSRFILGTLGLAITSFSLKEYSKLYFDIAERGWWYLGASTLLIIFAHDTYFYWTHRFMHWQPLFRHTHHIHHLSTNPTPWAAFSFHPFEAIIQFGISPLLIFIIPLHPIAIATLTSFQMFMNVIGHSGYEVLPSGFTQSKLFGWLNTPTYHNLHHSKFNCNYSLYFTFWDRLMGTTHPNYDAIFENIKQQRSYCA